MTKFVHRKFGTLEHIEATDVYVLNGRLITPRVANRWMETVRAAHDEIERHHWDSLQRQTLDSVSWWRHPIIRWKLERIYRRYRTILGPTT
jgi:hypothetical protein